MLGAALLHVSILGNVLCVFFQIVRRGILHRAGDRDRLADVIGKGDSVAANFPCAAVTAVSRNSFESDSPPFDRQPVMVRVSDFDFESLPESWAKAALKPNITSSPHNKALTLDFITPPFNDADLDGGDSMRAQVLEVV